MKTKLDYKREQEAERKIREKNLSELKSELAKAKDLLVVVNASGHDYKTQQEGRIVRAKIKELEELISDEQRAYDATFSATENEIERATSLMGL